MINKTADMIRPYVDKDPTKFCTTEDFEKGVSTLSEFVSLRAEAVTRQLAGDDTAVDTGDLNTSLMGSMGGGMGGGNRPEGFGGGAGGSFSISSMITLTDAEGNEKKLSDLLEDVSSLTLSDGTVVDLSSPDMKSLMSTDFTTAVSASDSQGNTADLTEYKVSVSMPGSGNSGRRRESESAAQSSSEEKTESSSEEKPQSGAPSAEMGNPFSGGSGERPDMGSFSGMPGGGYGSSRNSEASWWTLTGISALVLIAGIIIAAKTKHGLY
jgi:hypothetical protein